MRYWSFGSVWSSELCRTFLTELLSFVRPHDRPLAAGTVFPQQAAGDHCQCQEIGKLMT